MHEWQGKSALITGAGTGIGRAVGKELARRGALVYVSALTEGEAQRVADEITAEGNRAVALALDVTDDAAYLAAIERVVAEQGAIDILMNNAGMLYVGEFYEMDEDFLRRLIAVNHTAVAIGTLYGYRAMKAQGHGLIVNVASQGGLMPVGTMAAYAGTKHAVVGLTASVAGEAELHGVAFRTVCPGNIASDLLARATTRGTNAQGVLDMLPQATPTAEAAVTIVDGFTKKSPLIILPWYAKVMWWAQRLWPGFGRLGVVKSMERFRAGRNDNLDQH